MPLDDGQTDRPLPVRMRIVGLAGPWGGRPIYLSDYDVDANDGRGCVLLTSLPERAMVFASPRAALDAWRTQSRVLPLRPDNELNRPLTAYTVKIEPVEEGYRC